MTTEPALAPEALGLVDVRRSFGRTTALDGASCIVRRGTVHALLGENGAGKSTLMRIAFGMLQADSGTLRIDGAATTLRSSRDAIARGLGMVHQHFMNVPAMTVAENVALGGRGFVDRRAIADRVRAIGDASGLALDPRSRVADLPVGAQQRLEIVKALAHEARTLILDEPTAVLSPTEGAELMAWLRRFANAGGTVVLITHKLRDALAVADDVTVLRRGRTVLYSPRAPLDEPALVAALVGDQPAAASREAPSGRASPASRAPEPYTTPVFACDSVGYDDAFAVTRLRDVSLRIWPGEVIGVLGVEGAGQHELLRLIAGRIAPTRGRIERPDRIGFIPEDRLLDALVPELPLHENLLLAEAAELRGLVDWDEARASTAGLMRRFDVRAEGPSAKASTLSGGNQQKFVVGRERARALRLLVAENPTRGLDIRAASRVMTEVAAARGDAHGAIVLYSADIDEVLAVATRVLVCFQGTVREVAWPADRDDRTPFTRAMTGVD